jgi:DNA ligase-1
MREFVMLAKDKGQMGWDFWASPKMDGMRALWLPETRTRGLFGVSGTGLWSRGGKPIWAPSWFTDKLPEIRLDGELFVESYNKTMSVCRSHNGDWSRVKLYAFDIPDAFYETGSCTKPKVLFNGTTIYQKTIEEVITTLDELDVGFADRVWQPMPQKLIRNEAEIAVALEEMLAAGFEGLMLRRAGSRWVPKRTEMLIKLKPHLDSEARVVGMTDGKGKYVGMMGALIVEWAGKTFELSGMTDSQRLENWVGRLVTFRYNDLTPNGVPRFARFLREKLDPQ